MPSTLKTVKRGAFSVCSEMEDIKFKIGLKKLENRAFEICKGLKTVTIPYTIKRISKNIFYECGNLVGINYVSNDSVAGTVFVPYEPVGLRFIKNTEKGQVDFEAYDQMFKRLKKFECKYKMAFYRLKNGKALSGEARDMYVAYLRKYSNRIITEAIKNGDTNVIGFMGDNDIILKSHIGDYIRLSSDEGGLCTGYFINYRQKRFGGVKNRFVL